MFITRSIMKSKVNDLKLRICNINVINKRNVGNQLADTAGLEGVKLAANTCRRIFNVLDTAILGALPDV